MFKFAGLAPMVWMVKRCASGHPANTPAAWEAVINHITQIKLAFLPVKISDGPYRFNLTPTAAGWKDDILPGLFAALKAQNLPRAGWSFLYGIDPLGEAEIIADRVEQLDLQAVILDPEERYKISGPANADIFMNRLKRLIPKVPLALASYRYPTYHPKLPWKQFLEPLSAASGDVHMPQVYWEGNENPTGPAAELRRSIKELTALKQLPVFPIGAAYGHRQKSGKYWQPTPEQLRNFDEAAREYACPGLSYWCFDTLEQKPPEWWKAILTNTGYWFDLANAYQPLPPATLEERVTALETRCKDMQSSINQLLIG